MTDDLRNKIAQSYALWSCSSYDPNQYPPNHGFSLADALLDGPLAPLLELRQVLADLTEAVGRGDEHGLSEAYRAALRALDAS